MLKQKEVMIKNHNTGHMSHLFDIVQPCVIAKVVKNTLNRVINCRESRAPN